MAKPGQAHADFLAKLVAEGFLPMMQGKPPAKMPLEALPLTDEEKERAGAAKEALVVFYPVEDTGVFLQLGRSRAAVWYSGVDCGPALPTLERALKARYPSLKFIEENAHTESPGVNVRIYRFEPDPKHYADLEVMLPASKKARQQFMVRMTAWERTQ